MLIIALYFFEICLAVGSAALGIHFSSQIVFSATDWMRTEPSFAAGFVAWLCAVFFPMLAFVTCAAFGWAFRELLRDVRKELQEREHRLETSLPDRQDPAQR